MTTLEKISGADATTQAILLEMVGEMVIYIDEKWVARYCNDVYQAYVGLPRDQILGRTPFQYIPGFERSIFFEIYDRCFKEQKQYTKIGFSKAMGRWVMVRVFPCSSGGVLGLANEASEQVIKQHQLATQMVKDSLTGLPNKVVLTERLDTLLAAGGEADLVVLRINRFKRVNDAIGYSGGDMVLLELCSNLQSATIDCEELYRISGDEFAILRSADLGNTADRVLELQEAIGKRISASGHDFVLTGAAGLVSCQAGLGNAEAFLQRASLALKQAKEAEGFQSVWYEPNLERATQFKTLLEAELRSAISANDLELQLQPKGCLRTGSVVGAEALVRWNHPKLGQISPAEFLPVAAEAGLMKSIDAIVVNKSLEILQKNTSVGIRIPISINLSVNSLSDITLSESIISKLDAFGIDPNLLEIEIPEGALMSDMSASQSIISALRIAGIKVSVDDFGTGYSSFQYLAQFPIDSLKIDGSFIQRIDASESSLKIVRAMVYMARTLGLAVVAEGAESEKQITALRRLKCDQVQGFHFARPMPIAAFQRFVIQTNQAKKVKISAYTI